jgi:hypothetical protein
MDCQSCPALTESAHALELTEAALAAANARVEKLRGQIARLQQASGINVPYTRKEFAERAGVKPITIAQWQVRFTDCPHALNPGTLPALYERQAVEEFLARYPYLGKQTEPKEN